MSGALSYMISNSAVPSDDPTASRQLQHEPVAVLVSRFPAITETFILREISEMERQGQRIRLVPMLHDSPPVVHVAARPWVDQALFTPFISPAIILANLRTLLRQPLRYASLLFRLVAGTFLSPEILIRTIALFPKSVYLARRLEREGIRHIHAHYATHPATMALIIARLSAITFSFTVHAHDIFVNRRLLRWKLRQTRFVRSISAFNKRYLERLYPKEANGKIEVIHVGIAPDVYEQSSRAIEPRQSPPRLLCVAAHKPYKGLATLIEACRILRDEGVEFFCEVIGRGPLTGELQKMIDERQLNGLVSLAGSRTEEEVTRLMSEATLFVLPSTIAKDGQMEGIPVALMEALSSARAVVTTSTSGIPELVEHGVNGLLVEPDNPPEFAEAIRQLLSDPERARAMGLRGQAKVRREFELTTVCDALIRRLSEEMR
jgi:colanic acid/amylovoran biosynthesis glycosyltransferase